MACDLGLARDEDGAACRRCADSHPGLCFCGTDCGADACTGWVAADPVASALAARLLPEAERIVADRDRPRE